MKRLVIELADETVRALAWRIDDATPTTEDVARDVLTQAGERQLELAGERRPCQCGLLERAADDPDSAVAFDATTNEYNIVRAGDGSSGWIARFCFACGGAAPKSKRALLFARTSPHERLRLADLCKNVRTFDDAFRAFGAPDSDMPGGWMVQAAGADVRDEWSIHRAITYKKLSATANVVFTQTTGEFVSANFSGKYVGPQHGRAPPLASKI